MRLRWFCSSSCSGSGWEADSWRVVAPSGPPAPPTRPWLKASPAPAPHSSSCSSPPCRSTSSRSSGTSSSAPGRACCCWAWRAAPSGPFRRGGLGAHGVAEGSPEHRALRRRVLVAGVLAGVALGVAVGAPPWGTRLIDLGPTIYARGPMDAARRQAFLAHRGSRLLAFQEGRNATVSVWEGLTGRTLRVNGQVDASDHGDMNTQIMVGLAAAAARPDPASALVIGFGSGVTTRVLADVPGLRPGRAGGVQPARPG